MITIFENFNKPTIDIDKYLKTSRNGLMLVPVPQFDNLNEESLLNPERYKYARYNVLMRFFLYLKLLNYNGSNILILKYIDGIKNKDNKLISIINKIPNNNHVLNFINNQFNLNIPTYDYNGDNLEKFVDNWETILNDRYLTEYIGISYELSKKADLSERIVKNVMGMTFGKFYDIEYAETSEDLKGVDLWKINRTDGTKQSIQVKNIPNKINVKDNTIYLNNTDLDLQDYRSWEDGKLKYDYLGFYSKNDQKIYLIKSNAILSIDKNKIDRYIKIKLKNWISNPAFSSAFKIIDVPKKFIGKDASEIFYNPDTEKSIQGKLNFD